MKNITIITKLISAIVILVEDAYDGQPGVGPQKLAQAVTAVREAAKQGGVTLPTWLTDELLTMIINAAVSVFNSLGLFSKGK